MNALYACLAAVFITGWLLFVFALIRAGWRNAQSWLFAPLSAGGSARGGTRRTPSAAVHVEMHADQRAARAVVFTAEARAALAHSLRDDERIIWTGQPHPFSIMHWLCYLTWLLFAGTCAAATFVVAREAVGAPQPSHRVISSIAAASMLLALIGPMAIWLVYRRARRTFYVVTDRRALILEAAPFVGIWIRRYLPSHLKEMHVPGAKPCHGCGDLVFEPEGIGDSRTSRRGFLAVHDPSEIERLIREHLLSQQPAP